jgi:hypothetical protein
MLGDGANGSVAFVGKGFRGTPGLHHGGVTKKANFYDHGRETGGARVLR